jgi:hypothetical protein
MCAMTGRGRRRAQVPRSRGPLALALVAVLGVAVTVAALVLWPVEDDAPAARTTSSPPSDSASPPVDVSNLPIARSLDCADLGEEEVRLAIGGPVVDSRSYTAGERVTLTTGTRDLADEDSCTFLQDTASARVWVFASRMDTRTAKRLVTELRRGDGCTYPSTAATFGTPDLVSVCRERRDGRPQVVATLRGLFDDSWLSCEVADAGDSSAEDVLGRAQRWCLDVATTLGARP